MKIKLFLTSSLSLLGLWLAAAYMHQADMESYSQSGFDGPAAAEAETAIQTQPEETEFEAVTVTN